MNSTFPSQSTLMGLFRSLGFEKVAWSLRRIYTPVTRDALVLEVGSGGNPYPRSNVLLDAYEDTSERHWVPLTVDRPFVLGFVENLPFKDKTFDFVIASHVLEHSKDPAAFLGELMRVAKGGYIEVPHAFMERVNPYEDHRLEIDQQGDELVIRKKTSWKPESDTVFLYEQRAKKWITTETIPSHPFDFHVRQYWSDQVKFKIVNPDADAGWKESKRTHGHQAPNRSFLSQIKGIAMRLFRYGFSQNARNKAIDLISLMQCIHCHQGTLAKSAEKWECMHCKKSYPLRNGIPVML